MSGRFDFHSPGAAMAGALEDFLVQREAKRRQDTMDKMALDREARLAESSRQQAAIQQAQLESIDDQRKAAIGERELNQFKASHVPGYVGTAEEAKKYPGLFVPGQVKQGAHLGTDENGVDQYEVQQTGPTYQGDATQRAAADKQKAMDALMANPNIPQEVRDMVRAGVIDGSALASLIKPQTQTLFRASADRKTIERFENGQWMPHTGDVPKDAHWLQEPQPSANIHLGNGMTPTSEANFVLSMQRSWDKTRSSEREMQRQMSIMQSALARFANDPVGGSEGVRVTFEKILDPISVVREGEYARQAQGLSLLNKLEGLQQKYLTGGGPVPASALQEMVKTAEQFMTGLKNFNMHERERIGKTADRYGIPRDLVLTPEGVEQPETPAVAPAAAATPAAAAPKPGAPQGETPEQRRARLKAFLPR